MLHAITLDCLSFQREQKELASAEQETKRKDFAQQESNPIGQKYGKFIVIAV